MAGRLAFLEYTFMFNPSETWAHLSQFEVDLAACFKAFGFEAEIIQPVGGQIGRRILLISKPKELAAKAQIQTNIKLKTGEQIRKLGDVRNT